MGTTLRAALLAALILLALTPVAAQADSKAKQKAPAKAPAAPVVQAPAPTAQPRTSAPPPSASAAVSTQAPAPATQANAVQSSEPQAQAPVSPATSASALASSGTLTTEDARKQIAAEAPPLPDTADLTTSQPVDTQPQQLALRPTPQAATAHVPTPARDVVVAPDKRPEVDFSLPLWPLVALLTLSLPAIGLTILCVRRAAPIARILNTSAGA
jgi:hypothetical protein